MPSRLIIGLGPHRPSSFVDNRSHPPHQPATSRAGGSLAVGWDAIAKGVSMSRVATKTDTGVGGRSRGVEARRLHEANEYVRCVPTVCLLSCVFTPSARGTEVVDARTARGAEGEATTARGKSTTKNNQNKPPLPPVKQAPPPPLQTTLRSTFVSWRDAGYWCQWGHSDNDGGDVCVEADLPASRRSSVSSSMTARHEAPVRGKTIGAFGGNGLGDSFYIPTVRNKVGLGDSERRFSRNGLGDSADSVDDFRGTNFNNPLSQHNLSSHSLDNPSTLPNPISRLDVDVEKKLLVGVLALDQAGNRLTWLGRDLQASPLTRTVDSQKLGNSQSRDDHDNHRRVSEGEGLGRVQKSTQRRSWQLPLPAAAFWTSTAPAPMPSSNTLPSPSSLPLPLPSLLNPLPAAASPVGSSFALFAVAALAPDRGSTTVARARRIGPHLRAGGSLNLVLSMADEPSLSFLTIDHRQDVGNGHGQGHGRVFPLLPYERPLQVEWQWLPLSSSSSPAVALVGVLTNQRVLVLAASDHGLRPLNAHTHTHTPNHYHRAPSPSHPQPHSQPHAQPISWSAVRCGRWEDPVSSIAWMGVALLFTTRSGAVQYLLPAPPLPPRPTPSTPTSSRASNTLISRAADQSVALALGFLPAQTSAVKSHSSHFFGTDGQTHGSSATRIGLGGGQRSIVDLSAGSGMDNTGLCSSPPVDY